MKLIILYVLGLLFFLSNNVQCKKKKNKILSNIPKNSNLLDCLSFIAHGDHRNILSEVSDSLLKKLENNELVTKDMLLSTLRSLENKYKETDDDSKKKGIEKLVVDIKEALKKNYTNNSNSNNVENNEEDIKSKEINKKYFLLKLENAFIKKDLSNFKRVNEDIKLRKTYLDKKFKICSTSSEQLLSGAPGKLNLSDSSIKEIDYPSSIKIVNQLIPEEYSISNNTLGSPHFNKLIDLYKPLLDFNIDLIKNDLKNELQTYEDSKNEISFIIRDSKYNKLKKFTFTVPMSRMPDAKPNDEMKKEITDKNRIYTYVISKADRDKIPEEYILSSHLGKPLHIKPKRTKKIIKIPVKKKKKKNINDNIQINVKAPIKVGHLFLKKNEEDNMTEIPLNECHIYLKDIAQGAVDSSSLSQSSSSSPSPSFAKTLEGPVELLTVIKPQSDCDILKKIIIQRIIHHEPMSNKQSKDGNFSPEGNSIQKFPECSHRICHSCFNSLPLIHFNYPSGGLYCMARPTYENNSYNKYDFNEKFINLSYDKNCLICIPSSAINNFLCNLNQDDNSEKEYNQNVNNDFHTYKKIYIHSDTCLNCDPKNNHIFSFLHNSKTCPYCKHNKTFKKENSSSKTVSTFNADASQQNDIHGQGVSNFIIVNDNENLETVSNEEDGNENKEKTSFINRLHNASGGDTKEDNRKYGTYMYSSEGDSRKYDDKVDMKGNNNSEVHNGLSNRIVYLSSSCFDTTKLKVVGRDDQDEDEGEDINNIDVVKEYVGKEDTGRGAVDSRGANSSGEHISGPDNSDSDENLSQEEIDDLDKEKLEIEDENFKQQEDSKFYSSNQTNEVGNSNMSYLRKLYYNTVHEQGNNMDNNEEEVFLFNIRFIYKTSFFGKKKIVNAYLKTSKVDISYNKEKILYLFENLFKKVFKDIDYKIKESLVHLSPIIEDYEITGYDMDFGKVQAHYAGSINMFKHSIFDLQNMAIYFISPDEKYILLEDVIREIHEEKEGRGSYYKLHHDENVDTPSEEKNVIDSVIEEQEGEDSSDTHDLEELSTDEQKEETQEMEEEEEEEQEEGNEDETEETDAQEKEKDTLEKEKDVNAKNKDEQEKEQDIPTYYSIPAGRENEDNKSTYNLDLLKILATYGSLLSKKDMKDINDNIKNITVDKKIINGSEIIEIIIKKDQKVLEKDISEERKKEKGDDEKHESISIDGDEGIHDINETVKKYMDKYFSVHDVPIYYIEDMHISKNTIYVTSDVNCDLDMLKMSILGICNITNKSIEDYNFFLVHKDIKLYDPSKLQEIPSFIRNVQELYKYSKSLDMKIVIASIHEEDINSLKPKSFHYLYESNKEDISFIREKGEETESSEKDEQDGEREGDKILGKIPHMDALNMQENSKYESPGDISKSYVADNVIFGRETLMNGLVERNEEEESQSIYNTSEEDVKYINKEITILEDEEYYRKGNYYNFFEIYIDNPTRKMSITNAPILKTYTLNLFIIDIMNKIMHVPSTFINTESYRKGMCILDIHKCLEYYSYNSKSKVISSLVFEKFITLYEVLKYLGTRDEHLLIRNKISEDCIGVDNLKDIKYPASINLKDSKFIHLEIPLFYLDERSNFFHDKITLMNVPENLTVSELCTSIKNILNEALTSFNVNTVMDIQVYTITDKQWQNVPENTSIYDIKMNFHNLYTLFIKNQFLSKNNFQELSNLIIDFSDNQMYVKKLDIYIDYNFSPYTLYNLPIHASSNHIKYLLLRNIHSFLSDSFANEFFFTYNKMYVIKSYSEIRGSENAEDEEVYIYEGDESKDSKKITYLFLLNMLSRFYKIKFNSSRMLENVISELFELSGKSSSENPLVEVRKSSKKVKNIEIHLANDSSGSSTGSSSATESTSNNKILVKNVPLGLLVWKFINILMKGTFNVPIEDKEKLYNLFALVPKDKEKVQNHDYYFSTIPGYTIEEVLKIMDKNNILLIKAYPEKLNRIRNSEHFEGYIEFNLDSLPSVIDFNNPIGSLSFYVNYKNKNKITHIINVPENITTDKLLKTILLDMYSKWQKLPKDEKIKFSLFRNNNEITDMKEYINSGEGAQLRTFISLKKKRSDSNTNNNTSINSMNHKFYKKKYVDLDKISEVDSMNLSDAELKAAQLYDNVLREILVKDYIDFNNISISGYTMTIYIFDGTTYQPTFIYNVPLSSTNKDVINFLLIKANHINTKRLVDEFLLLNEESFNLLKTKTFIEQNVVFIGELTELINLDRSKLYLVQKPLFNPLDDLFKNIANKSYDFKSEKRGVLNVSEEKGNLNLNIMFSKNKKRVISVQNIPHNMYITEFLRFAIGYQRKWIYKFVNFYIMKDSEKYVLNDTCDVIRHGRTISEIFKICKSGYPCTLHIDISLKDHHNETKAAHSTDSAYFIRPTDNEDKYKNLVILKELRKKILADEMDYTTTTNTNNNINNQKINLASINFEYNAGLYEKYIFGSSRIINIPKSYTVGDVLSYIKKKVKEDTKIKSVYELELKIIFNDAYITIPKELNMEYVINYYFINTPSIVSISDDNPFNIVHLTLYDTIIDIKNDIFVKKSIPMYIKNGKSLQNVKLKNIPVSITEDQLITYLLTYLTQNTEVINFIRDNTSICVYPRCDPVYIHHEKQQLCFISSLSYHIALKNICYLTTVESYEDFYSKMGHFEFIYDRSKYFSEIKAQSSSKKSSNVDDIMNLDMNIHFPNIERTVRVKNFNMNMQIEDLLEKIFQSVTTKSFRWGELFTFLGNTSRINEQMDERKIEKKVRTFRDYLNEEGNISFIYKPENNEIHDYLMHRIVYLPSLINYQTKYISLQTSINGYQNSSTILNGFPDYLTPKFMLTLIQYNLFRLIDKTYLKVFGCSYEYCINEDEFINYTNELFTKKNDNLAAYTLKSENSKQQMKLILRIKKKETRQIDTIRNLLSMELNISCQQLTNEEDMEECNDIISSLNTSHIFWRNSVLGFMANSIVIKDYYNNTLMLPYIDYGVNEKILIQNILNSINISPYLYKLFELTHVDKVCVSYIKKLKNIIPHIQCLLSYGFTVFFDLHHNSKFDQYNGFKLGTESSDITHIHPFQDILEKHFVEFFIHNHDGTHVFVKNVYRDLTVSILLNELSKARCHIHSLKYNQVSNFYKLVYVLNDNEQHDISPEISMEDVYDLVIKHSKANFSLRIVKRDDNKRGSDKRSDKSSDMNNDKNSDMNNDKSSDMNNDKNSDMNNDKSSDMNSDKSSDMNSDKSRDMNRDKSSDDNESTVEGDLPDMYLSPYPKIIDLSQNEFQVLMFLQLKPLEMDNMLRGLSTPRIIINSVLASTPILSLKEYLMVLFKDYFERMEISQNYYTKFYEFDIDLLIINFNPITKKIYKVNSDILNNLTVSNFYRVYYNAYLVLQLDKVKIFKSHLYDDFISYFSTVVIDFSFHKIQK
ncbi:liver specific protein 1, putative [Plasmodium malariae]|uniref:Liver specific protein 1, putative n=1 Tax=Plasmodium malariae TaxID=5858 RepID=A0A1D3TCY3_PLAMA|nr:liver specific protein 1, putative [Plasmodium malariae]SCP02756.1 liver specific protein 1, putative [Plasmodium malariae]